MADQIVLPGAVTLTGVELVVIDQAGNLRKVALLTLLTQLCKLNVGLPTATTGLPTGALWNNAGVVNVV